MTIFLTTQYLEEADELADRVGIINRGQIVAEGTPAELKRRVGNDVIVASLAHRDDACLGVVRDLPGVRGAEFHGDELLVSADDGAATIGSVAVALATVSQVRTLTLRTPTLDDVFLELTGNRMAADRSPQPEAQAYELMEVMK
jgi:ABC-2 type transport system ATP-binding protein